MPENFNGNLSAYAIVDSTINITQGAFVNYTMRTFIDFTKSNFNFSLYQMIAGKSLIVRVSLLNRMGDTILNLTGDKNETEGDLTVHLIHTNTRNAAEFGRRIERIVNFSGS
jgi:hypothetical protein